MSEGVIPLQKKLKKLKKVVDILHKIVYNKDKIKERKNKKWRLTEELVTN